MRDEGQREQLKEREFELQKSLKILAKESTEKIIRVLKNLGFQLYKTLYVKTTFTTEKSSPKSFPTTSKNFAYNRAMLSWLHLKPNFRFLELHYFR